MTSPRASGFTTSSKTTNPVPGQSPASKKSVVSGPRLVSSVQRYATHASPASPSGSRIQREERWAELGRAQAITAKHRKALFSALAPRREADNRFFGRGGTLVDTKPVVINTEDVPSTLATTVPAYGGGRLPTISLIDFVAQQHQSSVQNQSTFYYSSLASLLPGTVPLFAPVPDPSIDLSSTGAQDAIRASAADIEASPYRPHLDQLVQHSPKLEALHRLLAERIDRRGEYNNGRDAGSVSLPLAAVVFCTRPVTTHIVHLALHRAFGDRAKVAGLYASRPRSQREATLALFRGPVTLSEESEATECAVGLRILITTMALVSTGVDLTRASLVIIAEPGVNRSQETKAAGRVQRHGQLASDVRLYELACTDDVMEKIVLLRQAVKASSVVDSDELRQAVATWLDLYPDGA
ncbi:DNA/RNA helicase [Niveomyces insectorum RCEF 264]|uniref:DNA/RNA helicase n=1 Tax=Niveomyces insectorum RCEF 264 TaxID=1081102 RepID=A0A167W2C8_9HYPO|nr:DNA/RNA helicase [Niveomyces insectorum RCEF 264]